jgi:hypothetical protein
MKGVYETIQCRVSPPPLEIEQTKGSFSRLKQQQRPTSTTCPHPVYVRVGVDIILVLAVAPITHPANFAE